LCTYLLLSIYGIHIIVFFFLCKCLLTFYTQCHLFLWTISLLILNLCIFMAFNQDIHDLWPIFFQYYKWSFIIHYSYTLPSWSHQWCDFWPYLMWNKQWYDFVLKCNGLWSNHEDGKFFLVTIKFQYLI
jgi:hypothetical protein